MAISQAFILFSASPLPPYALGNRLSMRALVESYQSPHPVVGPGILGGVGATYLCPLLVVGAAYPLVGEGTRPLAGDVVGAGVVGTCLVGAIIGLVGAIIGLGAVPRCSVLAAGPGCSMPARAWNTASPSLVPGLLRWSRTYGYSSRPQRWLRK